MLTTITATLPGSLAVGTIFTYAGVGYANYTGDGGAATSATFNSPYGIALDSLTGNMYIADSLNNVIRMITKSTGIITTVAGTGVSGYTGDNGLATLAKLQNPTGVAVDSLSGNIYSADNLNSVIRMVTKSTGIITRIAGTGMEGYSGDGGPATSAMLHYPRSIAVETRTGNIYICDLYNNVIRMVKKSTGIITTIAGTGGYGYKGDGGPATAAMLFSPNGVTVDASSGMVYIADSYNYVVRVVNGIPSAPTTSAGKAK